jgi:hypothetical protein
MEQYPFGDYKQSRILEFDPTLSFKAIKLKLHIPRSVRFMVQGQIVKDTTILQTIDHDPNLDYIMIIMLEGKIGDKISKMIDEHKKQFYLNFKIQSYAKKLEIFYIKNSLNQRKKSRKKYSNA